MVRQPANDESWAPRGTPTIVASDIAPQIICPFSIQPLVDEDEAALVPGQDLHPVGAPRHEHEEEAGVGVLLQLLLDDGHQAVDGLSHVDRRRADEDADGPRDGEHGLQRRGEGPEVLRGGASREAEAGSRRQGQLEEPFNGGVGLIRPGGQVDYAACLSRCCLSNAAGLT